MEMTGATIGRSLVKCVWAVVECVSVVCQCLARVLEQIAAMLKKFFDDVDHGIVLQRESLNRE